MFDPILKWIGTFLAWINSWSGNYIWVLLIFSIIIEILFVPFGIKQQKNSIRQAKLRPKEMAIRKKYAGRNDQATQQKVVAEIQELYKQENYNQFSGCLPLLIQLPIIMALYNVVINPLKYVVQLADTTIAKLTEAGTAVGDYFINAAGGANAGTINLITKIKDLGNVDGRFNADKCLDFFKQNNFDSAALGDLERNINNLPDFQFLGINLGDVPTIAFNWLLIVPILTFLVYFASMKLTRKLTYQSTMQDQQAGCSNKVMDFMMPLFSLFISFSVPAAVGVYWIFKSILGTVKQYIFYKAMPLPVFTEADYKAAEKEMKGKAPVEREITEAPRKSLCREDEDDDEPYPTFVGVKGGKYDDDSADDDGKSAPVEEKGGIAAKLDEAPLKSDKNDTEENQ